MTIKQEWMMESSDMTDIGEALGFTEDEIFDAIDECEMYGQDGDGGFEVSLKYVKDIKNGVMRAIFTKVFEDHPEAQRVFVKD